MGQFNINIVSVIIILIVVLYLIKGLRKEFSPNVMFYSIISTINIVLFFISLIGSIYITRRTFFGEHDGSIYKKAFDILPDSISGYLANAGILTYFIVTPLILMVIFLILQYLRSLLDGPIKSVSGHICSMAEKGGGAAKLFMGILIEVPKGIVLVVTMALIVGFLSIYYPGNSITNEAERSSIYNFVYSHSVSHIMESSIGKKIPVFFWSSVEEISDGIYDSKAINMPQALKNLSFLRFQHESKSNEVIDKAAADIVGDETDPGEKAYLIYKWLGDNISYDWEKYNNIINNEFQNDKFGAINTFNTRMGICEDYSDLFAAMARSVGLKVRIVVGQGYSAGLWGGHAWNEVYIPEYERWIPLDATWADTGDYFDNDGFYTDHIFEAVVGEW